VSESHAPEPSERSARAAHPPSNGPGRLRVPTVITDLAQLPAGSHCLDLFTSDDEAADHAAAFLAGALDPEAASYWVAGETLLAYCQERLDQRDPALAGTVHLLDGPQVVPTDGKLRPTAEIVRFIRSHPEGVTAGAATITEYWTREEIPSYLEYERWFHEQERASSRFLCPYDLRKVPVDAASAVLPVLAQQHSHVMLSSTPDPSALLLQLLLFPPAAPVPKDFEPLRRWGMEQRLLRPEDNARAFGLTPQGEAFAEAARTFPGRSTGHIH
jgi:hypothetical protein